MKSRFARLLTLLLAVAVLAGASDVLAKGKKKKKGRGKSQQQRQAQQRQAQLRAVQKREAALRREISMLMVRIPETEHAMRSAGLQLATAADEASAKRNELKYAKEEVDRLVKELASVELEAERNQGEYSSWKTAKTRHEEAVADCDRLVESILDSSEYREALRRIENSPNRGRLAVELRKNRVDKNPEVVVARETVKLTRSKLSEAKRTALAKNDNWVDAMEELKQAKQQGAELSGKLDGIARRQVAAQHAVRRMQQSLAVMQQALRKDKSDLASVERRKKSLKSQGSGKKRK